MRAYDAARTTVWTVARLLLVFATAIVVEMLLEWALRGDLELRVSSYALGQAIGFGLLLYLAARAGASLLRDARRWLESARSSRLRSER